MPELVFIPKPVTLAFDDTQKSVSGTTETEIKYFRFIKDDFTRFTRLIVRATLWVSGGTGYLKLYIDDETSPRLTLSTTSTSETTVHGSADISDLSTGVHTVHIKLVNSESYDTYNKLIEVLAL